MREFVPGYGPAIGGEGNAQVEGMRTTVNAAPVAPAAAATAAIFAAAELINVRTRIANEIVIAILTVERDNAGAAGNGTYRGRVDGVAAGDQWIGPTGTAEGVSTMTIAFQIAAPGAHTIGAQVTSNGDVETVLAGSRLTVMANEFVNPNAV